MFTKRELAWIIIASLIMGFIMSFFIPPTGDVTINYPPINLLIAFIIIFTSVICKKIAAKYFYVEIEHKIWSLQRWWYAERDYFKKPIAMGLILPFFLSILSLGYLRVYTLLQYDAENSPKRVLKRRGMYRHQEINESDLAFVSAWGFYGLLLLAIIGAIIKMPDLTKYAIYYGVWNMIPIGQLDGSKLFFGSLINWLLLAFFFMIALILMIIF
jgi:hypothetical protein